VVSAQKVYFLYLQSDDQTPFYVKVGDKLHSSALSGYLVLPNLIDSTYNFNLGFAKSAAPEAKFSVTINQADKGYIIKNFDDGLALFDLHDLSLVKANTLPADNTVYETKTDRFSSILSKAADDPGLLRVAVGKKEEPKPVAKEVLVANTEEVKVASLAPLKDTASTGTESAKIVSQTPPELLKDTTTEAEAETAKVTEQKSDVQAKTDTLASEPASLETVAVLSPGAGAEEKKEEKKEVDEAVAPVKLSVISRYSESSTTEGFGVVYFDKRDSGVDTVRILIPAPKVRLVADTETVVADETPITVQKAGADADVKKPESDTEGVVISLAETKSEPVKKDKAASPAGAPVINASCNNIATDRDFLKLRKKLAGKDSEDAMLDEARKEFRGRCYSVEQVRYLSSLFLTSASKYQFFDAAFNYVVDKNNFPALGSEIRDEHYSKRFKALIGE
jgi:hypothetical protein